MIDCSVASLTQLLDVFSLEDVQNVLNGFSCSKNSDIETFVRSKALDLERKGVTVTYLVFDKNGSGELLGFFSLTLKVMAISANGLSKTSKRRLSRFGQLDNDGAYYEIPSILIAQFGKNELVDKDLVFKGSDLMNIAIGLVRTIQSMVGGRYLYLECEDNEKLVDFYKGQGFTMFGNRSTEDTDGVSGERKLLQFLRYLN